MAEILQKLEKVGGVQKQRHFSMTRPLLHKIGM